MSWTERYIPPFRPGGERARWTLRLLIGTALLRAMLILIVAARLGLQRQPGTPETWIIALAGGETTLLVLLGLIAIPQFILFLMWLYRAQANTAALGARGQRYSPAWTVGGFFVPFWNLLHGYLAVQELWKASDPELRDPFEWQGGSSEPLIAVWWLMWVVSPAVDLYEASTGIHLSGGPLRILIDATQIAAALLLVHLIRQIEGRQAARHARMEAAAAAGTA